MIVEKTPITEQYFSAVQKLVVLQLGMVLLPVANQGEASQLITQLVSSYVSGETLTKLWEENYLFSTQSSLVFGKNTRCLKGVQHLV